MPKLPVKQTEKVVSMVNCNDDSDDDDMDDNDDMDDIRTYRYRCRFHFNSYNGCYNGNDCRYSHSDANLPIFDPFLANRPSGEAFFTGNTSGINDNKSYAGGGDGIDYCKIATRNRKDYHMTNDYIADGDDSDIGDEIEGEFDEISFEYSYENIINHNNNVTAASYYQQGSTNSSGLSGTQRSNTSTL